MKQYPGMLSNTGALYYFGDDSDVPCVCWDTRAQHTDGAGRCHGVELGTFGEHGCDCSEFRPLSTDLVRVRCAVPSCNLPRLVPREQDKYRAKELKKTSAIFYHPDEQEFYPRCHRIDCKSAWAVLAPVGADYAFGRAAQARRVLHVLDVNKNTTPEKALAHLKNLVEDELRENQAKVDEAIAATALLTTLPSFAGEPMRGALRRAAREHRSGRR